MHPVAKFITGLWLNRENEFVCEDGKSHLFTKLPAGSEMWCSVAVSKFITIQLVIRDECGVLLADLGLIGPLISPQHILDLFVSAMQKAIMASSFRYGVQGTISFKPDDNTAR